MEAEVLAKHIGCTAILLKDEKGMQVEKPVEVRGVLKSNVSPEYDVCYIRHLEGSVDMVALCNQIKELVNIG